MSGDFSAAIGAFQLVLELSALAKEIFLLRLIKMFERQGGVSSIRKLKAAYYMVKVSLAILFDRIRGHELPAAVPQPTA